MALPGAGQDRRDREPDQHAQRGRRSCYALRICNPKLIVVGSETHGRVRRGALRARRGDGRSFIDVDPEEAPSIPSCPHGPKRRRAPRAQNPPETATHTLEDMAAYIYTSGTTGLPKAALVRNLRLYVFGQMLGALGWGLQARRRALQLPAALPLERHRRVHGRGDQLRRHDGARAAFLRQPLLGRHPPLRRHRLHLHRRAVSLPV